MSAMQNRASDHDASPERIARLADTLFTRVRRAIGEIGDITTKQRLLTLNAQIEAARAGGSTGAAFAVVAGAMKDLSDQTAKVAAGMEGETAGAVLELTEISRSLATEVRGTRLSDLARTNIDLIDRNLYERSCDVRWWATDPSLVEACTRRSPEARRHASQRMSVILSAYTVYFDLVLCDPEGRVLANGRPARYPSQGVDCSASEWYTTAWRSGSGDVFGFQSVHQSPLVDLQRALVYSCAVREGGAANGNPIGVLGIVFNWDGLAQTIVDDTPLLDAEKSSTRVCIVDDTGFLLADTRRRQLEEHLSIPDRDALFGVVKGFTIGPYDGETCCIAHAASPGYETYRTGWHSVILQPLR